MRSLYEHTLDALRQMVGISDITQREILKDPLRMSHMQFLEEYCTIHVKGPRGCGHTSALIDLARERFAEWVVLITPNPRTYAEHVKNQVIIRWGHRNRIYVIRGTDRLRERFVWTPGSIRAVMVDNANYWEHEQLRRVVLDTHHLAKHFIEKKEPFFYIHVQ